MAEYITKRLNEVRLWTQEDGPLGYALETQGWPTSRYRLVTVQGETDDGLLYVESDDNGGWIDSDNVVVPI